jgi:hypothetical protein
MYVSGRVHSGEEGRAHARWMTVDCTGFAFLL